MEPIQRPGGAGAKFLPEGTARARRSGGRVFAEPCAPARRPRYGLPVARRLTEGTAPSLGCKRARCELDSIAAHIRRPGGDLALEAVLVAGKQGARRLLEPGQ